MLEQPFFVATSKTAYTAEFLKWSTQLLESCQASFDGITRTARAVHRDEGLLDRVERKHLTTAWFAREAITACGEAGLEVPSPDELGVSSGRGRKHGVRAQKRTLQRLTRQYRAFFRKVARGLSPRPD